MADAPSLLKPMRLMIARSAAQAEQARARIARLRAWRDRADLDKGKSLPQQPGEGLAVLVEARRQPERVRQVEPGERGAQPRQVGAGARPAARAAA